MVQTYQGELAACDGRIAVVVSRFNESITSRLLDGAVQTLVAHGVREERIDVAWTPGAFEIPTVAGRLAARGRHAAILCLGAVIRGETTHDEHINRAVSIALSGVGRLLRSAGDFRPAHLQHAGAGDCAVGRAGGHHRQGRGRHAGRQQGR